MRVKKVELEHFRKRVIMMIPQLVKMAIKYHKREKTPKYITKQQEKSKKLSFMLANDLYRSSKSIIMDDEKYFTLTGHNMPGNS